MILPPPIAQANLGMADSLILMVMALVVFGPRRLPQIGKQIGKLMYEFRKASNDFKYQMEEELRNAEDVDRRKRLEEERRKLAIDAQNTAYPQAAPIEYATPAEPAPANPDLTNPELTNPEPRILPPSTGAPVEAARPGGGAASDATTSDAALPESPATAPSAAAEDHPGKEAASDEPGTVTEQAAHHG